MRKLSKVLLAIAGMGILLTACEMNQTRTERREAENPNVPPSQNPEAPQGPRNP